MDLKGYALQFPRSHELQDRLGLKGKITMHLHQCLKVVWANVCLYIVFISHADNFHVYFFLSRTSTLSCSSPISFAIIIEGSHKRKEKYVDGLVSLPRLLMLFPHVNTKFQTAEFHRASYFSYSASNPSPARAKGTISSSHLGITSTTT